MKRRTLMTMLAVCMQGLTLVPAKAVTDGKLDGSAHPAVVLLLMEVGGVPAFRCTGTLLNARVLLTAGHCAGAPGEFSGMRVFTDSDVDYGKLHGTNNYPLGGLNSVEAVHWEAHPQYPYAPFTVHDVGVVILQAPGVALPAAQYGVLPAVNQL